MRRPSYNTFILASVGFLLLSDHAVGAQSRPSLAAELTFGGGTGRGGEFRDRGNGGARLAMSVRGSCVKRVAPYAELAMDWLSLAMGHDAVCYPSSRGGCIKTYPQFAGPELTAGVIVRPVDQMEIRAGVGGGAYQADGPRVGGVLGQLDAAIFPVRRVGVVAGVRVVVLPRYQGERLGTNPWSIGIRVR